MKIYKAELISHQKTTLSVEYGSIYGVSSDSFQVCCGERMIKIKELQMEAKKRMSVAEFVRGYHLQKGEKLGE